MAVEDAPSNADLQREVARLRRALAKTSRELARSREREVEGLARESTTAEILRVIAGSPTDLGRVLQAIIDTAARLCDAPGGALMQYRERDGRLAPRAETGVSRVSAELVNETFETAEGLSLQRTSGPGHAYVEGRTIHVPDMAERVRSDYHESREIQERIGYRTAAYVPLLRQGSPIGVLSMHRLEVRPFTEDQIRWLETFADQAVIAIENARLFNELQERNRELTEGLERERATGAILRVIAASPTDLQAVLDTIVENAARLCEAYDVSIRLREVTEGLERERAVAHHGPIPLPYGGEPFPLSHASFTGHAILTGRTVHIPDATALHEDEYEGTRGRAARSGWRTGLAVPLLREGSAIGAIVLRRREVRPFSEQQIALLETLADQAVIAIENTRLFGELRDRVEELQALGEVGQAVSSTLDLDEVLGTVVAHADQFSSTDGGILYEYDEATEEFSLRASRRLEPDVVKVLRAVRNRLGEGAVGRAALTRTPVQVPDITAEGAYQGPLREAIIRAGHRAVLAVPLLREDRILGGLVVIRKTPGEFLPATVDLVRTFASQSALAIQNARLYRELEDKSLQLEIASKHKSEFLANMSHELRTPLNAIIGFSEVLLEQLFGELNEKQLEYLNDILTSGQHLLSLINDILDLSKVEAGRMELELSEFSLREALENGLTMLKERAGRHDIALDLTMDPDLDPIRADERKVKQIVFNLLSNAVKFTPDGGRVDLSARAVDAEVVIAVRDTGIGIAPKDLGHVFDEFRQVGDGQARQEGTGLGLALTKKLVELHGGRIWVDSEPGTGSIFSFSLPRR